MLIVSGYARTGIKAFILERMSQKIKTLILLVISIMYWATTFHIAAPVFILGVGSMVYWYYTESRGTGDLRFMPW